jgi:hypothetical protein
MRSFPTKEELMEPTVETQTNIEPLVESAPDEAVIRALAQVSSYPSGAASKSEPLVERAPDEAVISALAQIASFPTKSVESTEGAAESDES